MRQVRAGRLLGIIVMVGCGGGGNTAHDAAVDTAEDATDAPSDSAPDAAPPACAPVPACTAVAGASCLSLANNGGKATQRLRIAQLTPTAPAAFTSGILKTVLANAVEQSLGVCNEDGGGSFNWVLETTGGTSLTFGGAKAVADPTSTPYTFVNETIEGHAVAPVTTPVTIDGQDHLTSTIADAVIPAFLDAGATQVLLLPLHAVIFDATLSSDRNCIGTFNAAGLEPTACTPDATHPQFLESGTIDGFIDLDEADAIIVAPLNKSLCVLLAGSAPQFTELTNPNRCKRDQANRVAFPGDWCSTTNSAATSSCRDAVRYHATFAASAVP